MSNTQSYLGIKNGVVLCVDGYTGYDLEGEFYHGYSSEPVIFRNAGELLNRLENLFDLLQFPYAATNFRDFSDEKKTKPKKEAERPQNFTWKKEERKRVMSDKEILSKHGDEGTFIVRVQQRQNSSWQGRITWVDEDKTVFFRSVWEMMKLIDAALASKEEKEEDKESVGWD